MADSDHWGLSLSPDVIFILNLENIVLTTFLKREKKIGLGKW
jgi:hypothetical protein